MALYGVIGQSNPTYLQADPQGADIIAIPCKPGNGVVNRGTIMYRDTDGMYAPAAAANAVDTKMLVVLDETVDTSANATIAEDARAYRAGRLLAGKVTLAAGAAVTADVALVLRKQGIVLEQMNDAATFDNEVETQTDESQTGNT